jgi:non-homologous end joining protein Ku
MVVVDPRGTGMVLTTLRAAEEVRAPQLGKANGTVDGEMLPHVRCGVYPEDFSCPVA